jgi:hypothetical protein
LDGDVVVVWSQHEHYDTRTGRTGRIGQADAVEQSVRGWDWRMRGSVGGSDERPARGPDHGRVWRPDGRAGAASNGKDVRAGECKYRMGVRGRLWFLVMQNAFVDLKKKFGLLNATTPLYLEAQFFGHSKYVEVDMDAWEELIAYIEKLRIVT